MATQYALVHGGAVLTDRNGDFVITGYEAEKPEGHSDAYPEGSMWLPVETTDSKKFDPFSGTHFRGQPEYRVEKNRVLRIYPIISRRG